ncbi:MAG: ketoacyl-ACP synthase III [Ignavibacteriae bacterium]|nr:ketoacyl-ACP synthase III [Ignavibacteriota bacterium]
MHATIKAISYFIPEKTLSNEDLAAEFPEWSVEKITSKIGIKNRHIANENETSLDLAVKSSIKLFEENKIDPNSIDYLLFCTQSPDYYLPTSACIIQDKLGLPTSCAALDFNLGCSGYIYGLSLSKALLESGQANNVLLIMAETYSKFLHQSDKSNRSIFGDAASSTLLSLQNNGSIFKFILGTDGKGEKNLIVRNGGLRNVKINNNEPDNGDFLFMEGSEIFTFTLKMVPKVVSSLLEKNNISMDEIDLVIFHQANKYMLETLRKKINIPETKFYYFIENVGNTVSSTIPIALANAINEKRVLKGSKIMLVGFGVGYSWGGTIIEL